MVNKIWASFIIIGIITFLLTNNTATLNNEIINSGTSALNMVLKIFPLIALWTGIMNIASASGLLKKTANFMTPVFNKLFPEIPKGHESLGLIASNIMANMFGLGNVATPFGLKAMNSLQTLNSKKDTASRSMITFLVLNTSGITIIPTTIIALRATHGSVNPTSIVVTCLIATIISAICGLIADRILARKG